MTEKGKVLYMAMEITNTAFAVLIPPQDDCLLPLASYVTVLPPSTTPSLCAHP